MRSALLSADGTMEALLTLPSDWGSGYCASVTVTNRSASRTTGWSMVVGLNGSTLDHGWVANITRADGQFTAANMNWNAELDPGRSTTWGFCGSGSGRPSIVSVAGSGGSITTSSSTSTSSSVGAGGEGGGSTTATTTSAGAGGEGGGSTTSTTTSAGAGGEGGGSTTSTTTTTTSVGAGGEGGGSTTTTTTTSVGAGGEGGGSTTATTTSAGAGGEGGGSTTATTTSAGAGGEGGGTTTTGAGGEGGAPPGDPACGPDTATFAQVWPILERSCANSFCHGSDTTPAGGLDLHKAAAVGALVNQGANSCSGEHALVVPFMPSSSYLMNKLNDVDLCDPDEIAMPPGSPLPAADLKTITDWICAGAPAD
ncbi:cellulose binding domain-containing protein [Sorangium sp. So ce119]|uniref:cellulose binding domain-containing protein n=1 Tax=Sorangium sp. So ce119 TaxID=3133279 RepID=UPI003F5E11AC